MEDDSHLLIHNCLFFCDSTPLRYTSSTPSSVSPFTTKPSKSPKPTTTNDSKTYTMPQPKSKPEINSPPQFKTPFFHPPPPFTLPSSSIPIIIGTPTPTPHLVGRMRNVMEDAPTPFSSPVYGA